MSGYCGLSPEQIKEREVFLKRKVIRGDFLILVATILLVLASGIIGTVIHEFKKQPQTKE